MRLHSNNLITLLKMQPHYGQSSRENVTLSSGTYHRPIVKKNPPSPSGNRRQWLVSVSSLSVWFFFSSFSVRAHIDFLSEVDDFPRRPRCTAKIRNKLHTFHNLPVPWILFCCPLSLSLALSLINLLRPDISMHILHTVLYTFPEVLTRRICLTIKSFFSRS